MCQKLSNFGLLNNRNNVDTSNFSQYPDSESEIIAIKPDKDPFINW